MLAEFHTLRVGPSVAERERMTAPILTHELASVRGGVYGHAGQGAPLTASQQERLKNCWQVDADHFLCGRDVLERSQIP